MLEFLAGNLGVPEEVCHESPLANKGGCGGITVKWEVSGSQVAKSQEHGQLGGGLLQSQGDDGLAGVVQDVEVGLASLEHQQDSRVTASLDANHERGLPCFALEIEVDIRVRHQRLEHGELGVRVRGNGDMEGRVPVGVRRVGVERAIVPAQHLHEGLHIVVHAGCHQHQTLQRQRQRDREEQSRREGGRMGGVGENDFQGEAG